MEYKKVYCATEWAIISSHTKNTRWPTSVAWLSRFLLIVQEVVFCTVANNGSFNTRVLQKVLSLIGFLSFIRGIF